MMSCEGKGKGNYQKTDSRADFGLRKTLSLQKSRYDPREQPTKGRGNSRTYSGRKSLHNGSCTHKRLVTYTPLSTEREDVQKAKETSEKSNVADEDRID